MPPATLDLQQLVPKVSDFGLAKLLDVDVDQTCTGMILGTPPYVAPEQASGNVDAVGPATDVPALAASSRLMVSCSAYFIAMFQAQLGTAAEARRTFSPAQQSHREHQASRSLLLSRQWEGQGTVSVPRWGFAADGADAREKRRPQIASTPACLIRRSTDTA